jgi:UDP-N-acetylglucosamine 2-epimerase
MIWFQLGLVITDSGGIQEETAYLGIHLPDATGKIQATDYHYAWYQSVMRFG